MKPPTTQKTLIQIQTLLPAVLLARLRQLMAADEDPKPHNYAEVFLARNMIALANQRYKSCSLLRQFLKKHTDSCLI
jgi:hypothetical protein